MGGFLVELKEEALKDRLKKAADLAGWLINEQGVKSKVAYIISAQKYKIPFRQMVSKEYNQNVKPKQLKLIMKKVKAVR